MVDMATSDDTVKLEVVGRGASIAVVAKGGNKFGPSRGGPDRFQTSRYRFFHGCALPSRRKHLIADW